MYHAVSLKHTHRIFNGIGHTTRDVVIGTTIRSHVEIVQELKSCEGDEGGEVAVSVRARVREMPV